MSKFDDCVAFRPIFGLLYYAQSEKNLGRVLACFIEHARTFTEPLRNCGCGQVMNDGGYE
jgi:hypothetical protein